MTSTLKNILLIGLGIAVIILLLYISKLKKQEPEMVSYRLPDNVDPKIFGPQYWFALHDIMSRIPCSLCRGDAEQMMVFLHDLTNIKTGKNLFAPENFSKWGDLVMNIRQNGNKYPVKKEA